MSARHILLGLLVGATLAAGAWAADVAEADRRLAAADFDGALKAYGEIAAADRANAETQQQFAILRQVVQLRSAVVGEKDPAKWDAMARALRSFYYDHRLFAESLPLDQQRYGRASTPENAAYLAETLLEMKRDGEASSALASHQGADAPATARLLYGIALARQGQSAPARAIAGGVTLTDGCAAEPLYHAARLQALLGAPEASTAFLARALGATTAAGQASLRARAGACPDFGSIASTPAFTAALGTASKVTQSKCTMGPSCGGCPMAKGCAHSGK